MAKRVFTNLSFCDIMQLPEKRKETFYMTKTTLRIISVSLVALMICFAFVSCDKPSGTYESSKYTLVFDGDNVTISWKAGNATYELGGTYVIEETDEGKTIEFTWEESTDLQSGIQTSGVKMVFSGKMSYVQGSDDNGKYIEIGAFKFYKK